MVATTRDIDSKHGAKLPVPFRLSVGAHRTSTAQKSCLRHRIRASMRTDSVLLHQTHTRRLDVAIGHATDPGPRAVNEDFAASRRRAAGDAAPDSFVAIVDGVSAGGEGPTAALTTVLALVEDFFAASATRTCAAC
jgi:hypothetical protein